MVITADGSQSLPPGRPPSVDALARAVARDVALPHALLVEAARAAIDEGEPANAWGHAEVAAGALMRPVVNATGVLLHTNLGRAPVAVEHRARGWNVEFDLRTGRRGSRREHAGGLVARLVGAESALVVNNGAAAVLLLLAATAAGRPVAVSRGELVEIGGGFRIPDVLEASGAQLREVGTTNRTRLEDYRAVVESEPLAALLKVHPSNYRLTGFTHAVGVRELRDLGPPVLVDLGSGLLDGATPWLPAGPPGWLSGEPAARQTLAAGAAAVTFSGDKLLGGPQAGIIAGRSAIVEACARHPLARAVRPGALVLHTLQETLLSYLRRDGAAIPLWRMATVSLESLRERAEVVARSSGAGVTACQAVMGGGALPGVTLDSAGVSVPGDVRAALRRWRTPVIGRMENDRTVCDLRSVDPSDDHVVAAALRSAVADGHPRRATFLDPGPGVKSEPGPDGKGEPAGGNGEPRCR